MEAVANKDLLHETSASNQRTKRPATWEPGNARGEMSVAGIWEVMTEHLVAATYKRRRYQRPGRYQSLFSPVYSVLRTVCERCGYRHETALFSPTSLSKASRLKSMADVGFQTLVEEP